MKTVLFTNYRSSPVEREAPFKEAKALGYTIILTHPNASDIPIEVATHVDHIIKSDPNNVDETLNKVIAFDSDVLSIDGAFSWTDRDVILVAKIGEKLALPTLPEGAALKVRNKYCFRKAVEHLDVCPKFQSVKTLEELKHAANKIGFPAIFKPVGASGSKGIFCVNESTDLKQLFDEMLEATHPNSNPIYAKFPNQYIYESYIEGQEICIDGLVHSNEIVIVGITDKAISSEWSLETKATFPTKLSNTAQMNILENARKVIAALTLENAAFHLEARFSNTSGFKVLECAGRPPGGLLTTHVYSLALGGYPWLQRILQSGCHDKRFKFDMPKPSACAGIGLLFSEKEGYLTSLNISHTANIDGIEFGFPVAKLDEKILLPPTGFSPLLACFTAKGDTYEQVNNVIDKAMDETAYETTPFKLDSVTASCG